MPSEQLDDGILARYLNLSNTAHARDKMAKNDEKLHDSSEFSYLAIEHEHGPSFRSDVGFSYVVKFCDLKEMYSRLHGVQ